MQAIFDFLVEAGNGNDGDQVPRDPRHIRYEGPWLQQQLLLSSSIGLISFLAFCLVRRKSPALFAPRTKLKGFTPHTKGIDDGIFSWIKPTLKTEEIKILHIVGLDAAILLSFFKMGFWVFFFLSLWSCGVLMPVNRAYNGTIDGVAPSEEPVDPSDPGEKGFSFAPTRPDPSVPWSWTLPTTSAYHLTHLFTTYLFSLLILRALYKGFQKFVRSRQLYALDLLQSIPARTVEVRNLPDHLRREKDLAEYFEALGLKVESTSVVREVQGLKEMLSRRANALYHLERVWCNWLGNPTTAEHYDADKMTLSIQARAQEQRNTNSAERLIRVAEGRDNGDDPESAPLLNDPDNNEDLSRQVVAPDNRKRPTMRVNSWNPFSKKVDAITLLEARFRVLDAAVKKLRAKGSPPSTVGFVTFVDAMSAQVAAQTVHYPLPAFAKTNLAPEPRDIIWSNVSIPSNERRVRQILVSAFTFAVFIFYIPVVAFLASFLSPGTIAHYLPGLHDLLNKDPRLMALIGYNLPSVVLIAFNALLPLFLEWTAYLQGLKARSLVEFSVLKRYHLFLLTSVIFIFLVSGTALGVLADLANNPMKIIDKLAQSLPSARHFSVSYVIFQALAIIPLQLLQLPVIFGRAFGRLSAVTPRDHAELNSPPQLYTGSVYPSALIVFTLCILYSIVSPIITVFGAIYFGLAYLVYKYKLLFVFYRSYESRGQAWPLSSMRCIWALCLFQIFQLSLFSVRKQLLLSTMMLPLIGFTIWFGMFLDRTFSKLSEYVNISGIAEVNRPVATPPKAQTSSSTSNPSNPILALRSVVESLDPSQTALSRKRYAAKDDTIFVARKDKHTDYREPPTGGYFYGTLNTGRRRYGHPALTGVLPEIWLPIRVEEDEKEVEGGGGGGDGAESDANVNDGSERGSLRDSMLNQSRNRKLSRPNEAVVVSLRKRKSSLIPRSSSTNAGGGGLGSSTLRIPPTAPRRTSQKGDGKAPSNISPSSVAIGSASKSSMNFPTDGRSDSNCEDSSHQHEDSTQIWGDSGDGPQGSSARASIGEALAGEESVAPSRRRLSTNEEAQEGGPWDEEAANADEEQEEEEEDDSDLEEEGVYMHRTAKDRLPGSFPGFAE
ncbi:hypothetical protein CBS101457_006450 [Exobasidium rhododendri]|nr:hypothetical protein CBS101457_006450 [Exobasidium rhododendri]